MKLTLGLLVLIAQVAGAGAAAQVLPGTDEAETHAAQTGIPGFLDPDTNIFTPLAPEPLAAFATHEGKAFVEPTFSFNPSIHEDDSVLCTLTVLFGNLTSDFFINHTARTSVSFTAGIPDRFIVVPYTYTPNSSSAHMEVRISCRVTNSSGTQYAYESLIMTGPVQNGTQGWIPDVPM